MNLCKRIIGLFIFFLGMSITHSQTAQKTEDLNLNTKLFESDDILSVRLSYSRKQIKKEAKDSIYIDTYVEYKTSDDYWNKLPIRIKGRGKFRRKKCHFTPLKLKIKKSDAKNTIFKGQKQLKMVLPCFNKSSKDDNVIKEYIVYKLFEVVSPYYFSTRMLDIEYSEIKKKDIELHNLRGLVIEDNSKVAKRLDAKLIKRYYDPQSFDNLAAVRNAMFQYMIGNTDFSITLQHNSKVIFVDKKFVPLPYDFDMSGFVNSSYAIVSEIGDRKLPINKVTDRYYVGYQRDYKYFELVREEFMNNKEKILQVIDNNKSNFENEKSHTTARDFILDFYEILTNETHFRKLTYQVASKM